MKFSNIIATLFVIGSAFALDEQAEKVVNKCYEELGVYEDCYVKYGDVTESELQKNCESYKSEKCQKYFEDPIKFVPTCSEAIGYRSISKLNNFKLTLSHYDEICVNNEKDHNEKVINKCYEELGEYEDCYVKYGDVSENELQKNCEAYKSEKCQKYFEDPIKFVPTCSEAIGYRSISKLNNLKLTLSHYDEICAKSGEDQKEKIINKCYEELGEYEDCYVKYGDVSESELQKNCESYKSEKCQKYFEDPIKYVPTCSEAIGYRSISRLNNLKLTLSHYDEICANNEKDHNEKVINKCYEELGEYEDCYVKYGDVSESELQKNCKTYKSKKCQKYFKNPIKYVPTCSEAIGYRSISRLNNLKLTLSHYDEICAKSNKKTSSIKKTTTIKKTTVVKKTSTVKKTTTTTSKKVPTSTVEGRCGQGFGACAMKGYCCSKFGYCGKSESYCGTGCQPKYGLCQ